MKKIISFLIFPLLLLSCAGQKTSSVDDSVEDAGTKIYSYADSCKHLIVSLSLELPLGKDSASLQIRDSLIANFIQTTQNSGYEEEGTNAVKSFDGDKDNPQELVDYYGKEVYNHLLTLAKSDYDQRIQYLQEDTTMSEEDRHNIMEEVPMWAFDLKVHKSTDNPNFVVYNSLAYVYYGGAHGGVVGSGDLTFDKSSGEMICRFINPDAAPKMQSLLRKGLLNYYAEAGDTINDQQLSERLQILDTIVPLPQCAACPNAKGDSLIFTYGQYEIACYADGMPSFRIAVKDLKSFLTPQAKALLFKEEESLK